MTEISFESDLNVAFLPDHQAALYLEEPKKKPLETVERVYSSADWFFWGPANSYPQDVLKACQGNSIISSTIAWKANQIASGDLRPGYMKFDPVTEEEKFVPIQLRLYPEIKQFIRQNNLLLYRLEVLRDLYWWNMAMPDLGLDAERNKIVSLCAQDMSECRFEKQNPKTGLKENVYLNANWPINTLDYISKMSAIDPYYDIEGQIRNGSAYRFLYPLYLSMAAKKYYQNAPWHEIVESKWLDVADKIPKLKSKLMDNQMHLKYIIHIPLSWWTWKYKSWKSLTEDQQKAIQKTEINNFNKLLTGIEGAGKSIFATFNDENANKDYAKWEIKELVGKIDSDMYIEDSQEASSHILYSINVDATLIGNSPGKAMGAGSGSDKRVAHNIFILSNKIYQDTVCAPLDKISQYNGWVTPEGDDIVWKLKNEMIATTDTQNPKTRL